MCQVALCLLAIVLCCNSYKLLLLNGVRFADSEWWGCLPHRWARWRHLRWTDEHSWDLAGEIFYRWSVEGENSSALYCSSCSNLLIGLYDPWSPPLIVNSTHSQSCRCLSLFDDDDDEGRINFSVALSPKTTRTRNNKPKQWSHVIVVSAMRRC